MRENSSSLAIKMREGLIKGFLLYEGDKNSICLYRFITSSISTSWFCCDIISEHNPFGWLWLVDDDASNGKT